MSWCLLQPAALSSESPVICLWVPSIYRAFLACACDAYLLRPLTQQATLGELVQSNIGGAAHSLTCEPSHPPYLNGALNEYRSPGLGGKGLSIKVSNVHLHRSNESRRRPRDLHWPIYGDLRRPLQPRHGRHSIPIPLCGPGNTDNFDSPHKRARSRLQLIC